jgi:hypothetical protein
MWGIPLLKYLIATSTNQKAYYSIYSFFKDSLIIMCVNVTGVLGKKMFKKLIVVLLAEL